MIGALMGDMIGAPYEFDRGKKTKEFPLFGGGTMFTDDSFEETWKKARLTAEVSHNHPEAMEKECRRRLPDDMLEVLDRFQKQREN